MADQLIRCRACGQRHGQRYLCDALLPVVTAMAEAAEAGDMTPTEFLKGERLPDRARMLGDERVMLRQLLIAGAVLPLSTGTGPLMTLPALVITGEDADGIKLPQWVFPASPTELRATRDVMDKMTETAIRRAAEGG